MSEENNEQKSGIDLLNKGKDVVSFAKEILNYIDKVNQMKFSCNAILRQYYMEVCSNLEFIRALKLDDKSTLKDFTEILPQIAGSLSIEIGASILYLSHEKEYAKVYKKLQKVYISVIHEVEDANSEDKQTAEETIYSSIFGAMIFTVNRIQFLKQIAASGISAEHFKTLRIKQRIQNIEKNLDSIRIALRYSDLKIFGLKREYTLKFNIVTDKDLKRLRKRTIRVSEDVFKKICSSKAKKCRALVSNEYKTFPKKVKIVKSAELKKNNIQLSKDLIKEFDEKKGKVICFKR